MSKLTTCPWFDDCAEEAANFYVTSVRACGQEAAVGRTLRYTEARPRPAGSVLAVEFSLAGQDFLALNGGPEFTFSHATSLIADPAAAARATRAMGQMTKLDLAALKAAYDQAG